MPDLSELGAGALANWPTDWFIVGAFVAIIAFDALRRGRARAAAVAFALPLALFCTQALGEAYAIGPAANEAAAPWGAAAIFAAIFAALYVAAHRITASAFGDSAGVVQALFAGLSATAILLVVWLSYPALDALWQWGPQVRAVFAEEFRFFWIAASYLALAFLAG